MERTAITPPLAPAQTMEHRLHNDTRPDPYYWLRERTDPAVLAYLQAENEYTDAVMGDTTDLQERLYQEMRGHLKETDQTVPLQRDRYFYYQRTEAGKQYPIYCRKEESLEAPEQILLDLNVLAADLEYLEPGNFAISPDQRFLAYALDTDGSERFVLRVKNMQTGEDLPDTIRNVHSDEMGEIAYGPVWANDNQTLYYVTLNESRRPYRLYRHRLGEDPADDTLLYEEENALYYMGLRRSKSGQYIFLISLGHTSTEVRFLDANDPNAEVKLVQSQMDGVEYLVSHHVDQDGESRFFILTNWDAPNFRVMQTPVATPSADHWQELIPHRKEVMLNGIECFRNHLVVYEREEGLRHIRIHKLRSGDAHRVGFNEPVYGLARRENPNFDSHFLRYSYASLVQPTTIYDYSMDGHYQILRKEQEVPGYHQANFTSERHWAVAPDGVKVPISLVYRQDLELNGENPMLLYGYGSYGISIDPVFDIRRISLLKRGFVLAIAHIRGGGEMGREWYEKGKFLHKKNTFADFIACAEYLIEAGYTNPRQLAIAGRSAGGLLMGAVLNMRPDLFAAATAGVPFVDVITTMLDPTIPLTVPEWDEWGNPQQPEFYHYMKEYSPYDNLEAKAYPHLLVTAGLNDPRVQYWEPAKWVARLRTVKTDNNLLLLKTNMGAGHSGASGRYDYLQESAFEYAFLLKALGLTESISSEAQVTEEA